MTDDLLTAYIVDKDGATIQVTNFTEYSLERDFFIAADGFSLVIGDDRASKLYSILKGGCEIHFDINDRPQLHGYIDKFHMSNSRHGGKVLTINGRDALGQMSDAICAPNMIPPGQQSFNPLQFKTTTTLKQALTTIFGCFGLTNLQIDDSADLTIGSGGKFGVKAKGKKRKGLIKNLSKNIAKNCRPNQNEGYLEYAMRLCKHNGIFIKLNLDNKGNPQILVNPPTYDRNSAPVYTLFALEDPTDTRTNILDSVASVDYAHQVTCLVVEATFNGGNYHRDSKKVIAVNELTGYKVDSKGNLTNTYLDSVQAFITATTGKNGYLVLDANTDLQNAVPLSVVGITNGICRPQFRKDDYAHSIDQLQFFASAKLSELQNRFFGLQYNVQGHSNNGVLWQPNTLVSVLDQTLDPSNPVAGNYWIQRRVFTKSRQGGTKTSLMLRLPNIYQLDVTDE